MSITKYIAICTEKGISSPEDICKEAQSRVDEINKILFEADKLRQEKTFLVSVLKTFNVEPAKAITKPINPITEESTVKDFTPEMLNISYAICTLIESISEGVKSRDCMNAIGLSSEDDSKVYFILNWLRKNSIITKKIDNYYIPGPKWEERPIK